MTYYVTFFFLFCYQNACVVLEKIGVYDWIDKKVYLKPFSCLFNGLVLETLAIVFLVWNG